jgi:3alpha(or 20beta)-hydroxysteroid dehydrogenase
MIYNEASSLEPQMSTPEGMSLGRLDGKVAIITGAARGMGASHAGRFVAEGARVTLADVLAPEGEALASDLGSAAIFIEADVTSAEAWDRVVQATIEAFGTVNVLVNNAGSSSSGAITETSEADFLRPMQVNQLGTFLGMRAVVGPMRRAGEGSIVNICSYVALRALPHAIGYVASKWAVRGMSRAAAVELGPDNIRVNSVYPGVIRTPMLEGYEELLAPAAAQQPIARIGAAAEVTNIVVFLASDESSFSSGSEFVVDGGNHVM